MRSEIGSWVLLAAVSLLLVVGLFRLASDDHPMSFIDEHAHLDTQFKVHNGTYPHRGSLYGPELIEEWACGVGHQAGPTTAACGAPDLSASSLASGPYTPGYIHYPTYFLGGEVFRLAEDLLPGEREPIDIYRQYSAVLFLVGVALCGWFSHRLGLRRSALVAGTFVPVAASGILMFGTMVNPGSTAVLTGALIAYTGIRWVLTDRGYWWLVGATALAAVTAVTNSLAAGAFLVATLAALLARRLGWRVSGSWRPRWGQFAGLAAVVVLPVLVFGQVIARRATVPDTTLYGFAGFDSWRPIWVGAVREIFVLHNPWAEVTALEVTDNNLLKLMIRATGYGIPELIAVVVFGIVVLLSIRALDPPARFGRAAPDGDETGDASVALEPIQLLAIGTIATILLYPPALRVANALTAGVDFGIVARYSMSFTPLLVWLALLATASSRGVARVLAALGVVGVVALCVTAY